MRVLFGFGVTLGWMKIATMWAKTIIARFVCMHAEQQTALNGSPNTILDWFQDMKSTQVNYSDYAIIILYEGTFHCFTQEKINSRLRKTILHFSEHDGHVE